MKRYIPIVASLMVFSLISCDEVMDLTQPEKAEVTYSNITLSLYQTGKYDLYLDEPEYQYNIMVEKSHCEKEAKAKLAVVDAKEFGEEYFGASCFTAFFSAIFFPPKFIFSLHG